MENRSEVSPTFPYPQNATEMVGGKFWEEISRIKPLELTEENKKEVGEFEGKLFEQYIPLKNITPETHTVYPQYFLTDTGWRLFQIIYQDPNLTPRVISTLESQGVKFDEKSIEDRQAKKKLFDGVFKDLLAIAEDKDKFAEYQKKGLQFEKAEEALGGKIQLALQGEITASKKPTTVEEAEEFFYQIPNPNLKDIQGQLRKGISAISGDWARNRFLEEFQSAGGNVEQITNPTRISRVIDPTKLLEKVRGYRKLKKEWKKLRQELLKDNTPLNQAKITVLNIYSRCLNLSIAEQYLTGRVLATSPNLSLKEKEAYQAIKGTKTEPPKDRFSPSKASRTMERIDHFIVGIAEGINPNTGLYKTISEKIDQLVAQAKEERHQNPTFQKYNAIKINAQQAETLGNIILQAYNLDQEGWTIYIDPHRKSLACAFKEKGKKIKQVKIPENYNRGLIDTLIVLSHEIEGHALRRQNQEALGENMRLFDKSTTGRGSVLSEAAAIYMEKETLHRTTGEKRPPSPYYYLILKQKRDGGSFRDCFQTFMEALAKEKGQSLREITSNNESFKKAWQYAYSRTLRIFRRETPLDDTSGYLPASPTLHYIEQEIIGKELEKAGLVDLLFLGGIDLYSLVELKKLGLLNFDKINKPKYAAVSLFTRLREQIDQGKTLEQAIEYLFIKKG